MNDSLLSNWQRSRRLLVTAGLLIALATMLGAFGTHGLKPRLSPEKFDSFEIAVTYHFFHALGLLGIALFQHNHASLWLVWSTRLLLTGIGLFSGSIYLLTFGAPSFLGMVAPLGGLSLMAGWVFFAIAAYQSGKEKLNE